MSKEKTLVLIDGHALVHRAYHALPPLNTSRGELVNAVFGFTSILLKILKELRPDYIAATFDLAGPTFRHKEFEDYKATRVKAPDELYQQINRVKDVLKAFNIPIYEKEGFEADDLLGTIAHQLKTKPSAKEPKPRTKNQELKIIIATGDLDTLQLVDKNTSVYTLKKGVKDTIVYDEKAVQERYGLAPSQMTDFKGLKGDPSDNIPGVPGVGEKTAIELLKEYGTIENLYRKLETEKPKLKTKNLKLLNKLLEYKEQAFFSQYLATIKKDAPIKFNLAEAAAPDYDKEQVVKLFKEMGFYSLLERLGDSEAAALLPSLPGEESKTAKEAIEQPVTPGKSNPREEEIYEKIEQAKNSGILSDRVYKLEKALAPVISRMEKTGIKIDIDYLASLGVALNQRLLELEKEIHQSAGVDFNINSPQQLSDVLFNRLQLKIKGLKKTPGRVVSTAAPELIKLRDQHKIIDAILEYRELAKLKTTYVDALPKLIGSDGRVRTTFDQLGTATGRLSSKNPNLQNIPIKTELGREIRKAFVAAKGYKLLAADYSQIELRVVASLANDVKMINALKSGGDIHILTAHEVFDVRPEEVSARMRQAAKALNFGVIYGMSVHGFSQASGLPPDKAKAFIQKYFDEFHGVAKYVEKTKEEAAKNGYVQTLFGRKRFIPEINSSVWNLKAAAERMAVNLPVQGTAADLIKMAMVEINLKLKTKNLKLLLQVHDELVFEVPKEEIQTVAQQIKDIMENVCQLAVPLKVEIKAGDNWGEMERINP